MTAFSPCLPSRFTEEAVAGSQTGYGFPAGSSSSETRAILFEMSESSSGASSNRNLKLKKYGNRLPTW